MESFNFFYSQDQFSYTPLFTGIIILAFLDFILKGFALWRAAGNKQVGWFIALFVINTAGILPLIYLLSVKKKTENKVIE